MVSLHICLPLAYLFYQNKKFALQEQVHRQPPFLYREDANKLQLKTNLKVISSLIWVSQDA